MEKAVVAGMAGVLPSRHQNVLGGGRWRVASSPLEIGRICPYCFRHFLPQSDHPESGASVIDIQALEAERERLRKFCLHQGTSALIVIGDLTRCALNDPRGNPAIHVAEWLLFALTVDAARFADSDDGCDEMVPSTFIIPTQASTKRDVGSLLEANRGLMPFIIDYRVGEALWPLIAPHQVADTRQQIKIWDRGLRQRLRIGGLVTCNAAADNIAIAFDGSLILRRRNGETLDVGSSLWRTATVEISRQRCLQPDQWQRRGFNTQGNA
jgi:hypothetical protein